MHVKRKLCIEAFRIEIRIEGQGSTNPGVGKLTAGQRQPLVRYRVVGNVGAIQGKRLAVKEVREGFIGGGGIAQAAGGNINPANKVLIQLSSHTQARADTGSIAVRNTGLKEAFTAHPNVAGESEAPQGFLQCGDALLGFLPSDRIVDDRGLHVSNVARKLGHGALFLLRSSLH
jgi:hypothetical protein